MNFFLLISIHVLKFLIYFYELVHTSIYIIMYYYVLLCSWQQFLWFEAMKALLWHMLHVPSWSVVDWETLSFTHETNDILRIYAIGNLFTHDMQKQILFTHDTQEQMLCTRHTQTYYYLRMICKIYTALGDTLSGFGFFFGLLHYMCKN